MKEIAAAFFGIFLLLLSACSGGAKDPAASTSPESVSETSRDKTLTETESTLVDPDKTPSPEIALEVVNTVLR